MTIELDIVNRIVWSININKHSSLQIGNWLSDTRKTKKEKKKEKDLTKGSIKARKGSIETN